jgi:putative protease
LFDLLADVILAGVDGLKIEGRMKTVYYVAVVTRAYRKAIDLFFSEGENYKTPGEWRRELDKVSHRPYMTGFVLPGSEPQQVYARDNYERGSDFLGIVGERSGDSRNRVEVRGKIVRGDKLEVVTPERNYEVEVSEIWVDGEERECVNPGEDAEVDFGKGLESDWLLRKNKEK